MNQEPIDTTIEKLMALTPAEFAATASRLVGRPVAEGLPVDHPLDIGRVEVTCIPLPPKRLGGLLDMPQARVTIRFCGVPEAVRAAFMAQFDLTFRRGGG
jgi:hypothetical protein